MICPECKKELEEFENAKFCPYCGTDLPNTSITNNGIDNNIMRRGSSQDRRNEKNDHRRSDFEAPKGKYFFYRPGDNAFARCTKIENGKYFFSCIDGASWFSRSQQNIDELLPDCRIGSCVWVRLRSLENSEKYYYAVEKIIDNNKYFEWKNLFRSRNVGDVVKLPVCSKERDCIYVAVGPNSTFKVSKDEISKDIDYYSIKINVPYDFKIIEVTAENGKKEQKLEMYSKTSRLWDELPDHINNREEVSFSRRAVERMLNDMDKFAKENLFDGQEPGLDLLIKILEKKYQEAYAKKQVTIKESAAGLRMDFDLGVRNQKGVPQSACFSKKTGMETWALVLIGFASAECIFTRYVYVPSWYRLLNELSDIVLEGEEWDYKGSTKGDKYILRQYLLFDFYKSWLDGLIIEENDEAIFNTGLVDNSYDEIYCYLKKNTNKDDFYERKWEFGYFACKSKGQRGKEIYRNFTVLPNSPTYVNMDHVSELYFDTSRHFESDYTHIIEDNLKRLPIHFLYEKLQYDSQIKTLLDTYRRTKSKSDLAAIDTLVKETPEFTRKLEDGLREAIMVAKKYCKWNYKTAIPIYYPRNNSISLLLPLKLSSDPKAPVDVALVVERLANGKYQGQTILTLEMAYQDARQICRPNSEWLSISNIIEEDADDEDDDGDQ